ncbi:MAG: serine protease [Zoogloeaceae bacterium]|jgi:hypothetical protein|nr:serine protease [Zoogloeaceae bacterium]
MKYRFLAGTLRGFVALVCAGSTSLAFAAGEVRSAETVDTLNAPWAQELKADAQLPRVVPVRAGGASGASLGRRIVLDPVDAAQIQAQVGEENAGFWGARQIGFSRDVQKLNSQAATLESLVWQTQADGGQMARVSVASPGAEGIRLGVRIYKLPAEALLQVHAPDDDTAIQFSGREILDRIASRVAAGDDDEDAALWRTPVIEAEEAVLDIVLPPGVSAKTVGIAVPDISHLYASSRTGWGEFSKHALHPEVATPKLGCHKDVVCSPEWEQVSRATAFMVFNSGAGTYVCTGTLLSSNGSAGTPAPYFLTANHCISQTSQAADLETRWLWRSASCNGSSLTTAERRLYGGATLIYTSTGTDTTLLKLNETPPVGVAYAGWQAGLPSLGAAVGGVHAPNGALQKLSLGSIFKWEKVWGSSVDGDVNSTLVASAAEADHIRVTWTEGTTESGSSGSGLFDKGSKKLIGTLHGGSGSCGSTSFSIYGRFDIPFNAKLHEYLDPAPASPQPPTPTGKASRRVTRATPAPAPVDVRTIK